MENVPFLKNTCAWHAEYIILLFSKEAKNTCTLGLHTGVALLYETSSLRYPHGGTFVSLPLTKNLTSSTVLQFVTVYERAGIACNKVCRDFVIVSIG